MTRSALALLLFLAPAASADKPSRLPDAAPADVGLDAKRLALIDDAVNDSIKAKHCPGAVVLVARQGKVAYRKAYGQHAVEPKKEDMTTDVVFDLASLTKPVATAASVLHLVQKGKLRIDDPVSKHLPAFDRQGKDRITIEQLLLHTSGLPAGNPVSAYEGGRKKAVEAIAELRLAADPGKKFTYSDLGFILLGELVEKVSGEALDVYARKNLFEPLGLPTLTFLPDKKLRDRCAPTQKVKDEWLRGVVHDPRSRALGGVAGHAGLFGTADDLAVFAQTLLDGGVFNGKRILDAQTVKLFTTPRDVPGGKRTLGWDARTSYSSNRGEKFAGYGHTGFTGTSIWIDPEKDLFVVVLTNRVNPTRNNTRHVQLRRDVADAVQQAVLGARIVNWENR
jgi:CubicO group peptidase (beta-lactamase class C family)